MVLVLVDCRHSHVDAVHGAALCEIGFVAWIERVDVDRTSAARPTAFVSQNDPHRHIGRTGDPQRDLAGRTCEPYAVTLGQTAAARLLGMEKGLVGPELFHHLGIVAEACIFQQDVVGDCARAMMRRQMGKRDG